MLFLKGGHMKEKKVSLVKLFFSMMEISAFTFGGGFVIISMMQKKFYEELHWVSKEEVLDMSVIAQSAPGALAVNSAIIFGYRIAGMKGALLSTLATILPPIVIISIVYTFYTAFSTNVMIQIALQVMRVGVAAIIADVVVDLAGHVLQTKDFVNIILMIVAFLVSWLTSITSIQIILFFLVFAFLRYFLEKRKSA